MIDSYPLPITHYPLPISYFNIKSSIKYDRIKSVTSGEYLCQKQ
ncbi:MAG: hypothetical protein ACRC78_15695 [Planktothrix sp.]